MLLTIIFITIFIRGVYCIGMHCCCNAWLWNCTTTNTKRMTTDTKRSSNDTRRILIRATQKTDDYRVEVFLHCLNFACSKIEVITINIPFSCDIRQLVIGRIRIRLLGSHVAIYRYEYSAQPMVLSS